jgi:hypothetical protein
MKKYFPKMMWTIANFSYNIGTGNPVLHDMVSRYNDHISSCTRFNKEDIELILQTAYFFERLIEKNLLRVTHLEDILPSKEINRMIRLKKEMLDQDVYYQKDLKLIVNLSNLGGKLA